ncbi:MAG: VOC family protein [Sporolactobacillus sp.]
MSFHSEPNIYVREVHLLVQDLEAANHFYQQMIGLKIIQRKGNIIQYSANGTTPLLTLEQREGLAPHNSRQSGLYHMAFLLPTREHLALLLRHLLREQYPLQGGADHAVSEAIYLADPEGNGIEFYHDRPADTWQWTNGEVNMLTVELDPDLINLCPEKEWEGIPSQTILGHLHLQIADLKAAEHFYGDGLGFQRVAAYGNEAYFLSTGGYHHHLGLNTWMSRNRPAEQVLASAGMLNFTIVYPDEEKRTAALLRLKKSGLISDDTDRAIELKDPSGLQLRLVC